MFRIVVILLLLVSGQAVSGVTAEDILGEYWKDPLFGEALADKTIRIEVLSSRIWPEVLQVDLGEKVRVLVENKTEDPHMIVFTQDIEVIENSEDLKTLIKDELYHAKQSSGSGAHSHSHSGSDVENPQSIVKTIEQTPTVFVREFDTKEVIIRFDEPGIAYFACMIDSHRKIENKGIIRVR